MARIAKDMRGQVFGKLIVLKYLGAIGKGKSVYWECLCQCGNIKNIQGPQLRFGNHVSCGCGRGIKHGMCYSSEYKSWISMKSRCYNKKNVKYPIYGERGITVCKSWLLSFNNFFADLGPKPSPKHTLERIKYNDNYDPSNCIWALPIIQNRNKRDNVVIKYNGKTMLPSDWAAETGLSANIIRARIRKGWSIQKTLTTAINTNKIPFKLRK